MLGSYRLILALLVALSHASVTFGDLNPGVIAVVGFYVISGYVMTGLIRRHYAFPHTVGRFYLDRAARLFPHYLAVLALVLAWFVLTGKRTDFLTIEPTWRNLAENVAIVPLNYYMFNGSLAFAPIPPAWSLGAEIQFYLIIPWLILAAGRVPAFVLSIVVYVIALWGAIDTDWYAYRLLPGVLFMFLLGSALHDRHHGRLRISVATWAVAGVSVIALTLALAGNLSMPFVRETLLGTALGATLVHVLGPRQRTGWDELLGHLSYGVFLNHFFVKWALFDGKVEGAGALSLYLVASVVLAACFYAVVEKPVLRLRASLRYRGAEAI